MPPHSHAGKENGQGQAVGGVNYSEGVHKKGEGGEEVEEGKLTVMFCRHGPGRMQSELCVTVEEVTQVHQVLHNVNEPRRTHK